MGKALSGAIRLSPRRSPEIVSPRPLEGLRVAAASRWHYAPPMNGTRQDPPEQVQRADSPNPMNPLASPEPWTLVAEGYQEGTRLYLELFSRSGLEWLEYDQETEVVDVACGPGTTSLLLAPQVKRVACVDFSEGMLAQLRRNVTEAGLTNIDIHHGDGAQLPFADQSFDLGVSMFGLMFFPNRPAGFRELYRVLRPGGRVLVSSWAPISLSPAMRVLFGALRAADPSRPEPQSDINSLENPKVFERELVEAGFKDVRVEPVEHPIEVYRVEDFWQDMVRGSAPLALLRRKLGEANWSEQEKIALDYLRRELTDLPTKLGSTAYLAVGTR